MSAIQAPKTLDKVALLRLMMRSREGDRREGVLLRQSKGWFQVGGQGHEALAVLAYLLRDDDWLFPYYRDRAMMIAKGLSDYDLALAYFAKRDSSSGGRQMPGHYSDRSKNVFSVCTPTGGTLIPAAGTAWAMKLSGKDTVCVATIGDAAARQGEFYEAVSFAIQEKLPVIFVVEDNKYGISTPTEKFLPFHLDLLSQDAFVNLNARLVDEVDRIGRAAIAKARAGEGPTLIWAELDRLASHTSSDDHRVYRSPEDIEEMFKRDPIQLLAQSLIESGEITEADVQRMQDEVAKEIDEAYIKAEAAEDPRADELMLFNKGEQPKAEKPPIQAGSNLTMVDALNTTFKAALEQDPAVIFFGEDIEDPKGGVFKLTANLSTQFPKQVFNSPLAEATILGVAVGMAAYGMRPVFELQFIDFIAPGWNQVVTNMSTLRWRSFGKWKCPLVIYAPYGAYLPGGSLWHSMSNEAGLAHVPGINVVIPSTPEDAAGLMWTAIHADDPTFVLIPKHIFRKRVEVKNVEPVPLGKARIVREGSDVTIVTYGNTIEIAEEVANDMVEEASIEIIDLRSIVPCDYETIAKSLEKTGRLVVLHEDTRTCGFGQSVISEVVSDPEKFNLLLAPPQLVCRDDVHIGFNPVYEYAALPDAERLRQAVRTTLQ
jgi:2-oxoisovalerate dehydrogenase E1 component